MEKEVFDSAQPEESKEEREPKGGDELRKELEAFPYLSKPLSEWSDEEKSKFLDWVHFNNLRDHIWAAIKDDGPVYGDDSRPVIDGYDEASRKKIEEKIRDGKPKGHSKKFYYGTKAELYRNIRQTIVDTVPDLDEFRNKIQEIEKSLRTIINSSGSGGADPNLLKEYREVRLYFYVNVMPALVKLLDSGYRDYDLTI